MIGQTVSHYKILEKLGEGGMGEVYLAEDTKLDRKVALKFLPGEFTKDKDARERFKREAKAAAALNHPNIVTIYEINEHQGQTYIAMEYVEGHTLKDRISSKDQLPITEIIEIAEQICRGLQKAHEAGIVHRDIKPANIIIDKDHRVKILDFGLAKLKGVSQLTQERSTLGTLHYMSPEQVQGKDVDHRTDIWSLGVVLYEMLTGGLPFKGDYEQAVVYSILNEDPRPMSDILEEIGSEIEPIAKKLLAKKPESRYSNINDVSAALKSLVKTDKGAVAGLRPSEVVSSPSIAVLPFRDMSQEKDQDYFCEGIAEEIINALTHIEGLRVIARTSAFSFKDRMVDVRDIGNTLGVETLLEGSVRKAGNRLRITAQLVRASDGSHLWSERYDREMDDLFQIQDDVSLQITRNLKIKLNPREKSLLAKRYTEDIENHTLYLKGRFHWSAFTEEGFKKGIECFQEAILRDSTYALAMAGISLCYAFLGYYQYIDTGEAFEKAETFARRALSMDDNLTEAHLALGWVKMSRDWDWTGSEAEFKRAIDLNPGYYSGHLFYSVHLSIVGRNDEAIAEAEKAEDLDPLTPLNGAILGLRHYYNRDYYRAIQKFRETLEMSPGFSPAHWMMALPLAAAGEIEEAIEVGETCCQLSQGINPISLSILGITHALSPNSQKEAHRVIDKLKKVSKKKRISAFFVGMIYTCLGDKDEAFQWYERAEREQDSMLMWIKADPIVNDRLGDDSRYIKLTKKLGLDK